MPILALKVDVDTAKEVAKKLEIKSMPTFMVYVDGKETLRTVGFDQAKLLVELEKHAPADKKTD